MTGMPYYLMRLNDEDVKLKVKTGALWSELTQYVDSQYLVYMNTAGEERVTALAASDDNTSVASSTASGSTVFGDIGRRVILASSGLRAGRAYIVRCLTITSDGAKIIKFQDPTGEPTGWFGAWSKTSPLWTKTVVVSSFCLR